MECDVDCDRGPGGSDHGQRDGNRQCTLAVSGAPVGATATFTPPSLAAGAGATNVALTIQVLPGQTASLSVHRSGLLALGLLPFMLVMLLPMNRKIRQAAGKCGRSACVLLLILAGTLLAGLLGCGGGSSAAQKVYTMTVTATSGTLSHSTTLTLTVQ